MGLRDLFSSKSSGKKLAKKVPPNSSGGSNGGDAKQSLSSTSRVQVQNGNPYGSPTHVDIQTGERQDVTAMLHSLAHHDSFESMDSVFKPHVEEEYRKPGEERVASLPDALWEEIASYLTPLEAANLAYSNNTLLWRLRYRPWDALDRPENRQYKIDFLLQMDTKLPDYIFCFSCAVYHLRTQKGQERLKPTMVLNPLFNCPNAGNPELIPPRIRLANANTLPFAFVQLVMRAHRYSPEYGIPLDWLFRRWKDRDSEWTHETSYYIKRGHLLMRVVSRCFAQAGLPASGQRHLLYSPMEDYTPYFSVCTHWRDGELMNVCKCALGHIPKPKESIAQQLSKRPQFQMSQRNANPIVTLCSKCRPMRRCPECPTEYMVEIKFAEDRNDPLNRFKQAIVVTRWSDLGDGISPLSPEWAAINGETDFDSFGAIGKRTISGTFESQSGVAIPGQRLMSLNPKNEKLGEEGNNWY
jgi:hypothetical protein